jgi:hypothetical protein
MRMYCPRCAVKNLDDAKFCRACGADIRLVPQALQGILPGAAEQPWKDKAEARGKKKERAPATIDAGLKKIFEGFALFVIFLLGVFVFRGAFWLTIWFIIPAFASVGEGIGQLIRARQERSLLITAPREGSKAMSNPEGGNSLPAPFAPVVKEISSPDTSEIVRIPAGSVTDVTTRHLDTSLRRR